jgi:hypothetical protein
MYPSAGEAATRRTRPGSAIKRSEPPEKFERLAASEQVTRCMAELVLDDATMGAIGRQVTRLVEEPDALPLLEEEP